ncbi:MAG: lauroyl acyltransferase [Pseudomonadota bacterium]|nr:lauroyl acyltransferase [Pseudomonadota bacterium]
MARYSKRYWQKPSLRHYIEFVAVWPIYAVLSRMPIDVASGFLSAIGRTIGPRLTLSNRIRDNVRLVWANISDTETERIVRGVWDNFARVCIDYWCLDQVRRDQQHRIDIVGAEHLDTLRESGKSGILLAGHIGNWEMVTLAAQLKDLPLTVVYRPINNPLFDAYVRGWQSKDGVELIMKGREGARRLLQILKGDRHTIMLVDVRMNDGVRVPFLGLEAMTPAAPAALALKNGALLVLVRVERTGPAHFRVTVEKPRKPVSTGNRNADIKATMTWVNGRFSEWINDRPEEWMWFHRRWGKRPKQTD